MKFGYFDDANKEYVITSPKTPLPWINYLGSENFFSLISNTCDATVSTIFDTKHAIGLATESGLELLIHIGVDTVELGGKFYTAHVKDGDEVKKGQTLITFDMDAIKAAGYDVTTPLIVTNTDDYEEVKMLAEGTVNNSSEVLEVK